MGSIDVRTVRLTTSGTDRNAVNEVQTIDLGDVSTADTFTLTHGGTTTSAITYSTDMSAAIQSGLEGLASIGTGNVRVSKTSLTVYVATFQGTKSGTNMGAITITGATGFTPTGVTETTSGRAAATAVLPLGGSLRYAEVLRVRIGLFEDASTNDVTITDAEGRTIFSVTGIDTNVSGALYDQHIGVDGQDQSGNALANVGRTPFEGPITVVVKTAAPAAAGEVRLFVRGQYSPGPRFRERNTGTLTASSGGSVTATLRLGEPYGIVKALRLSGFDSSTDFAITDANSKNVYTKTAVNATTAVWIPLGTDGLDQNGNAAADALPNVAKSPLTVTITNAGNATTGSVRALVEV